MIVTIDGPAGSGKSTVARLLAERLQVHYLDTGAMYRAIALAVIRSGTDERDEAAVAAVAETAEVDFDGSDVLLNGRPVGEEIRDANVTAVASIVAANPGVRKRLVELQKAIGRRGDLVTEGRDQGTIVFPKAEYKFFITASPEARARRRHRELLARGTRLPLQTVERQLRQRDERDENRACAPMKAADDAILVDTTDMSIAEVVEEMAAIILSSETSGSQPADRKS